MSIKVRQEQVRRQGIRHIYYCIYKTNNINGFLLLVVRLTNELGTKPIHIPSETRTKLNVLEVNTDE